MSGLLILAGDSEELRVGKGAGEAHCTVVVRQQARWLLLGELQELICSY